MVDSLNIGTLLGVINQRIEVLLNRDYCLGHAYFLPLRDEPTLARLSSIFRQQVLPLLQEYFFEDWARVRLVLNDHRKTLPAWCFIHRPNATLAHLFGDVPDMQLQDNRWVVQESAFQSMESYIQIVDAAITAA